MLNGLEPRFPKPSHCALLVFFVCQPSTGLLLVVSGDGNLCIIILYQRYFKYAQVSGVVLIFQMTEMNSSDFSH